MDQRCATCGRTLDASRACSACDAAITPADSGSSEIIEPSSTRPAWSQTPSVFATAAAQRAAEATKSLPPPAPTGSWKGWLLWAIVGLPILGWTGYAVYDTIADPRGPNERYYDTLLRNADRALADPKLSPEQRRAIQQTIDPLRTKREEFRELDRQELEERRSAVSSPIERR